MIRKPLVEPIRIAAALTLLGCLSESVASSVGPSYLDGSTSLRVLLDEATDAELTGTAREVYLSVGNSPRWFRYRKPLQVQCPKGKVRLGKRTFPPPLRIRGGVQLNDPVVFRGVRYPGEIVVWPGDSRCLVVNRLPLGTYLAGTLASEMHPSWPLEALKAQAVASRTYALHRKKNPKHARYELVATILDQVYGGETSHASVSRAVKETDGYFLTYEGKLAPVFFHSSCGGKTTSEAAVWNTPHPRHVPVKCPFCIENPKKWTAALPLSEILPLLDLPRSPLSLQRTKSGPGKRWHELQVKSGSARQKLRGDDLRRKVGYTRLRSTLFENWKVDGGALVVSGRGNGHGVGMCQWGARHLAIQGMDFKAILRHYYPLLSLSGGQNTKKPLDFSLPRG